MPASECAVRRVSRSTNRVAAVSSWLVKIRFREGRHGAVILTKLAAAALAGVDGYRRSPTTKTGVADQIY
jgi:hypothetical protein